LSAYAFSISGCLYAYTFSGKNTKHAPDAMAANNNDKALLLLATKIGILSAKLENLEQLSLRLGKEAGLKVQVQNEAPGLGGPLLHAQTPRNAELEDLLASIEARLANKAEELSWIEDYLIAQKALKGMLPWQTPMEIFSCRLALVGALIPSRVKKLFIQDWILPRIVVMPFWLQPTALSYKAVMKKAMACPLF